MPPEEIAPDSRPVRHPDSSFRAVGDEGGLVILPGRAEVQVLNPVGISVFTLLDGKLTVGEIAARIVEEYDVTEEQALKDIREFITEMAEQGMLAESATTAEGNSP